MVQKGAKFGRELCSTWWLYSPGPTGELEYSGSVRPDFDKKPSLPSVGIMFQVILGELFYRYM